MDKRFTLRAEVSHEVIDAYENKPTTHEVVENNTVHDIVKNQLMDIFSRELRDTRFKDIKIKTTPQHITYEMELFIFNEDEIKQLVEEIAIYNNSK